MNTALYSTAQVAAAIGVHRTTIARLATQHQIGTQPGHGKVFTASDLERLRSIARTEPGCPLFTPGNTLGKLSRSKKEGAKKKSKKE